MDPPGRIPWQRFCRAEGIGAARASPSQKKPKQMQSRPGRRAHIPPECCRFSWYHDGSFFCLQKNNPKIIADSSCDIFCQKCPKMSSLKIFPLFLFPFYPSPSTMPGQSQKAAKLFSRRHYRKFLEEYA
jgi:hypothetical protein